MSHYYGDDEDMGARMQADSDMADLHNAARLASRMRRAGVCPHGGGWDARGQFPITVRRAGLPDYTLAAGHYLCGECGRDFDSWQAAREQSREAYAAKRAERAS